MSDPDEPARTRYYLMMLANLLLVAGAVLGLLVMGRALDLPTRILGAALLIASLWSMAVVPQALARRWRTPPSE